MINGGLCCLTPLSTIFQLYHGNVMTKKNLKLPKGQSEVVNGRSTNNTIVKRKKGLKDKQR